ncbi:MAG: ATP-binding cassette domain-containing protein [Streptosporangiales bacterium]|nr:ATP-binding cassette domain-containing protein [Streptosporangiales bacterium]
MTSEEVAAPATGSSDVAREGDAVVTRGLGKRFRGGQFAVRDLALDVPRGSVFGFLGPNGSGKTTTIRMLLGLATPTTGEIQVLGRSMPRHAASVLPKVGALIEGPAGYPWLRGAEMLARLDAADPTADPRTRTARVAAALDRVGLGAAARKKYRAYSLGMRQRLCLAGALLQPRELLVLDEPTNGLDPQGTREIRSLIRELATEGVTVMLSSHLLAEVEQVCTDVAVLNRGRLVLQGTVDDLRTRSGVRLAVTTPDTELAAKAMRELGLTDVVSDRSSVTADPGDVPVEEACAALVRAGVRVRELTQLRPSLEDSFVQLTGEGFDVRE